MQAMNSIKVLFMIFSPSNCRKHTKYLLLAVAFIFSSALEAYESIFPGKSLIPPFSLDPAFRSAFLQGGRPFPHKIWNENQEELSLESFKGNVVVVVLFTTWCPNCPIVLLCMQDLVKRFKKGGISNIKIIVLNVGNESPNFIKIYYKGRDIQLLDVYHSLPAAAMSESGVRGVPACLIFDKSGSPVCGYLGAMDYSGEEFVEYLEKLAKQ
jgi:thiol-disulfide isomerase/thioredoxin